MKEMEIAIRALCIVTHAEHNLEWAVRHQKRINWAFDIVRQVAVQPMSKIDGDEQ